MHTDTRVTHEVTADGIVYWAECSCGAEAGPFPTAAEARAATLDHKDNA